MSSITRTSISDYPVKYVAFLDILGFSDLVQAISRDQRLFDQILAALQIVNTTRDQWVDMDGLPVSRPESFGELARTTSFSDSIVISYARLSPLVGLSAHLIHTLFMLEVFVRGAIAKGQMFHDGSIVFGDGLIQAYRLESTLARYPRVIVSEQVAKDLAQPRHREEARYVHHDEDGLQCLDVFNPALLALYREFPPLLGPDAPVDPYAKARHSLTSGMINASDPTVFEKLHWLAQCYNEAAEREGLPKVTMPKFKAVRDAQPNGCTGHASRAGEP